MKIVFALILLVSSNVFGQMSVNEAYKRLEERRTAATRPATRPTTRPTTQSLEEENDQLRLRVAALERLVLQLQRQLKTNAPAVPARRKHAPNSPPESPEVGMTLTEAIAVTNGMNVRVVGELPDGTKTYQWTATGKVSGFPTPRSPPSSWSMGEVIAIVRDGMIVSYEWDH